MIQLNKQGVAWRNYLFANHTSSEKDIDNFKTRVSLIGSAKEQWMETLLTNEPNRELINECKEEIDFQKENLKPMLQEFVESCKDRNIETNSVDEMLNDICQADCNSGLYRIIADWEDIAKAADSMWNMLEDRFGRELNYMRDDLCELFMDTVKNNDQVRKIFLSQSWGSR